MMVPQLEKYDLEHSRMTLDFDLMRRILIDEWKFHGLDKPLTELKNEFSGGKQLGLFG